MPRTSSASKSVGLQDGDAEGQHDLPDAVELEGQVVGHLVAGGLVLGVQIVAEGAPGVEGYGQVLRRLLLEQAQQDGDESVGARRRFAGLGDPAAAVADARQREVGAVGEGVTVDQEQARHIRHRVQLPAEGSGSRF